jgi:hypothetical protein
MEIVVVVLGEEDSEELKDRVASVVLEETNEAYCIGEAVVDGVGMAVTVASMEEEDEGEGDTAVLADTVAVASNEAPNERVIEAVPVPCCVRDDENATEKDTDTDEEREDDRVAARVWEAPGVRDDDNATEKNTDTDEEGKDDTVAARDWEAPGKTDTEALALAGTHIVSLVIEHTACTI